MVESQVAKMQALLCAEDSPLRQDLLGLGFDALSALPVSVLFGEVNVVPLVLEALTTANAERVSERHVLPAVARVLYHFESRRESLSELLPETARQPLREIVARGEGPRFEWLDGAVEPADVRALFAPLVQQLLLQFAARLPLGGLAGQAAAHSGLGGFVGRIGKQVQKGAGQLADVGKAVFSGIGGEVERRLQSVAHEFSETAAGEFRTALLARLQSPEGKVLSRKLRDGVLEHVLRSSADQVFADLGRLPAEDIAQVVSATLGHLSEQSWFRELLEGELRAVIETLGDTPVREVLREAGLFERTRAYSLAAVDPGLSELLRSESFAAWLQRLLEESV